jgi:SepF-like predicted cell division protein (DUF552 family)
VEHQITNQKSAYSQRRLYIKTISIHDYSQLQDLKQNLTGGKDSVTILIARIAPIMSKDPEAAAKLVNELYDLTEIRSDYTLFRLGNDRLLLVPNNVQTQQI